MPSCIDLDCILDVMVDQLKCCAFALAPRCVNVIDDLITLIALVTLICSEGILHCLGWFVKVSQRAFLGRNLPTCMGGVSC